MLKHLPRISSTRIVLGVTAIIVGYFLVMGAVTALRSSQLSDREDRLRADIAELQQRYERLELLREHLGSDEYIEAVAREQLGLVREGESGIVVISTAPTSEPDPDAPEESELWWQMLTR
ncbi:MAG: septum formation initiator family protein [Chloroflexi bacterium]|nr:septum formation initiator family protein [Chloroflexota bacterium]